MQQFEKDLSSSSKNYQKWAILLDSKYFGSFNDRRKNPLESTLEDMNERNFTFQGSHKYRLHGVPWSFLKYIHRGL